LIGIEAAPGAFAGRLTADGLR